MSTFTAQTFSGPKREPSAPTWPAAVDAVAYHGLVGDTVARMAPHTESDPMALLIQLLVMFGSLIGRGPHFVADGAQHFTTLYVVLVGQTALARKGTSEKNARRVLDAIDPDWRPVQGLASGEGLIYHVRDPLYTQRPVKVKGRETGELETVLEDPGVEDKRLFVVESEFARTLRVMEREGSTLSAVLRTAWDGDALATLTKNHRTRATGAHISVVGHITADELRRYLTATEAGNGFGNRFLWLCVKRSQLLPEGGLADVSDLVPQWRLAIDTAWTRGCLARTPDARAYWADLYVQVSRDRPGLFGAMTARAEAQIMRLALLYALLDGEAAIGVEHLRAAAAVWRYSEASCRYLFGDSLGDPIADELLRALRRAGEQGLSRTELHAVVGRHASAERLIAALDLLLREGLATRAEVMSEAGRKVERWYA